MVSATMTSMVPKVATATHKVYCAVRFAASAYDGGPHETDMRSAPTRPVDSVWSTGDPGTDLGANASTNGYP
jgi:hypothetical protein